MKAETMSVDSKSHPLVSVIMPVLNEEKYIAEALESLANQEYPNLELIVVDDGSSDSTPDILENYSKCSSPPFPLEVIRHAEPKGVSAAKNTGLAKAKGKYLAIVAGDDVQKRNRISLPAGILEENSSCDMVFLDCDMIDFEGNPLNRKKGYPERMTGKNAMLFQLRRNHLFSGLFLARREACPTFDETLPSGVDYEWSWRALLAKRRIRILHDSVTKYRIHQNNLSANAAQSSEALARTMRKLDLEAVRDDLSKEGFPKDEIAVGLAWASLAANRPEQCLGYLRDLKTQDDGLKREQSFAFGVAWWKTGNLHEAEKAFTTILEDSPSDAVSANNLAVLLALQGKAPHQVAALLEQAVKQRSEYRDASDNLTQARKGDLVTLRFTERPLRDNVIHDQHYRL